VAGAKLYFVYRVRATLLARLINGIMQVAQKKPQCFLPSSEQLERFMLLKTDLYEV
jgi:hypothetical protein